MGYDHAFRNLPTSSITQIFIMTSHQFNFSILRLHCDCDKSGCVSCTQPDNRSKDVTRQHGMTTDSFFYRVIDSSVEQYQTTHDVKVHIQPDVPATGTIFKKFNLIKKFNARWIQRTLSKNIDKSIVAVVIGLHSR